MIATLCNLKVVPINCYTLQATTLKPPMVPSVLLPPPAAAVANCHCTFSSPPPDYGQKHCKPQEGSVGLIPGSHGTRGRNLRSALPRLPSAIVDDNST